MKTMKKNILLLCVLFSTYSIYSQTAITSSGGTAIGEGGSATYSIGQLVYTTQIQNNVSIAQGGSTSLRISRSFK